jgi:phenylalanyl-tRNA synthetase beta chain
LEKRIGQKLRQKEITGILERLGFKTKILKRVQDDFSYDLTVPSWRSTGDVSIAEDIVEEVARIYGYNKLAKASLHVELIKPVLSSGYSTERRVKNFLAIGAGMSEVFNYAWDEQHILQKLYGPGWQVDRQALANPPADEHKYLKNSLVPGLVKNLADNLRFSKEFRIFEIARVFTSGQGSQDGQDKIPGQPKFLAGAVVGKESFFVAKGVAEGLLESLGLWFEWRAQRSGRFASPGMSLKLKVAGEELGSAFLLESNTAAVVDIDREASFFEIDISKLARLTAEAVKFRVIPEFPAIDRDVALVVDKKVTYSEILSLIESSSTLLSGVRLFDVYQGKQIGTSKKQYAFRLVFQDMKKTLTSEEAEAELKVIIDQLKKKVGAQLRS